jgi:hypothetical protein
MPVSIVTPSLLLRSATRSDSCLPPPFVSKMKGMRCDCRYERAFCARGSGSELRTSTPSILTAVSGGRRAERRACQCTQMRNQILELWLVLLRSAARDAYVCGRQSAVAVSMFAVVPTCSECGHVLVQVVHVKLGLPALVIRGLDDTMQLQRLIHLCSTITHDLTHQHFT